MFALLKCIGSTEEKIKCFTELILNNNPGKNINGGGFQNIFDQMCAISSWEFSKTVVNI